MADLKPSTAQLAPCASGLAASQPAPAETPASAAAADPALPKVSGAELCSTAAEVRVVGAAASWARRVPLGGSDGNKHSGLSGAGGTAAGHPVVCMTTACHGHRLRCIATVHSGATRTCSSCSRVRLNGCIVAVRRRLVGWAHPAAAAAACAGALGAPVCLLHAAPDGWGARCLTGAQLQVCPL
jgi:hypothetical protein